MAASISAFQAIDGTLFLERSECEEHDFRKHLQDKYGEVAALELEAIVRDRNWLFATLTSVKAATVASSPSPQTPATHGRIIDPSVADAA